MTERNGSTGMPISGDLPGGGSYRICTRWCIYPDDREFLSIGVQPHIEARLTFDYCLNRFDSVFDKGLEVLRGKVNNL